MLRRKSSKQNLFSLMSSSYVPASLLIIFFLLMVLGCDDGHKDASVSVRTQETVEVNGIRVPIFSTADEQLNYTRSWFADLKEKRAALLALIQLYPDKRELCGSAALELAYLALGRDYRFALEHAAFAAIKAYKTVIQDYSDFPALTAKAYWYIGWIYSSLLDDAEKGVRYFAEVVDAYPEAEVSLLPPAPWVSIIYQEDSALNNALYPRQANRWAALALLEMTRHATEDEAAWLAFLSLWQNYRSNIATGFGVKHILARRTHTREALAMAREYMEKNFSNVHILSDIQKEIAAIETAGGLLSE